ncbi:MAG: dTDP-4-amino-4,6-dideoxygalactose transaminase [Acidobacteria bacterium]|nr:dTDP-4-amino-4,6-dideoxygalactose transaminase [Acidobacteriota bacterium]
MSSPYRIPFNKPGLTGQEWRYVSQTIADGHISGDGAFTRKCHAFLERHFGARKALLTTSCTHALEMSALLLGIQKDDEVIFPPFTFVSTVNAFVLRGARPVFADIRPDTLNLNENLIEAAITPRTRAIVPVHYAGVGCEMDRILEIAGRHGLAIVEDNAHGLFAKYRGRPLGVFGALAAQSFHETKNVTCGEGGALIVNDERYAERAEIIREKGTNRSRFLRGEVDKYSWIGIGSSYLPSDLLAAFLFAQLEAWERIQAQRRRIWERYSEGLREWAGRFGAGTPYVPPHCEQPYHMFYLRLPSLDVRQALIQHLKSNGILSVSHYLPLHLSDMGLRFGGRPGDCPVCENVADRLLRLPFYNDLQEDEQHSVIETVKSFTPARSAE